MWRDWEEKGGAGCEGDWEEKEGADGMGGEGRGGP